MPMECLRDFNGMYYWDVDGFLGDFNEMVVEFHGMLMDFEGTF